MADPAQCPRCESALGRGSHDSDPCPRCGGVFVPREQLAPVLEALRAGHVLIELGQAYRSAPIAPTGTPETLVQYCRCPHCGKHMNRRRLVKKLDVTVDVCAAHGVWFDGGELHRAAKHFAGLDTDGASEPINLGPVLSPFLDAAPQATHDGESGHGTRKSTTPR